MNKHENTIDHPENARPEGSRRDTDVLKLARLIGQDRRTAQSYTTHADARSAAAGAGDDEYDGELDRLRSAAAFHHDRADARTALLAFTRARSELDAAILLARAGELTDDAVDALDRIETNDDNVHRIVVSVQRSLAAVRSLMGSAGWGLGLESEVTEIVDEDFAAALAGMWSDRPIP